MARYRLHRFRARTMPRQIGDAHFFSLIEVSRLIGVHRTTLLRWISAGKVPDARRDRHGWRLFSEEQVETIKDFALYTADPADERDQLRLFTPATRFGRPATALRS